MAVAALALAGCSAQERDLAVSPRAASNASAPIASAPPAAPLPEFRAVRELARSEVPVRLRIPALGIDAPVGSVGQAPDGTVEVPGEWQEVGWYDRGPRPGEDGPAVLLGHVDSKAGPAVFVRLPQVQSGTVVEVVGEAGAITRFRVDRVEQYPKTRFPTEAVYLPALRPELRLVTCGGEFDRATGHYRDNIVAYASLVA